MDLRSQLRRLAQIVVLWILFRRVCESMRTFAMRLLAFMQNASEARLRASFVWPCSARTALPTWDMLFSACPVTWTILSSPLQPPMGHAFHSMPHDMDYAFITTSAPRDGRGRSLGSILQDRVH